MTASSYTPVDAQALTHIPFIAEFSLTCKGVAPTGDVPIYANVEGAMIQVAKSKDGSKYQVGWSTEMKKAKTGDYEIRWDVDDNLPCRVYQEHFAYNISLQYSIYSFLLRFSLYDEDGYAAIKRVVERGEDIATVKPIATVVINYPVISHNKLFGKSLKYIIR